MSNVFARGRGALRRLFGRRSEDGNSAVEFALVLPVMATMALGFWDAGQAYFRQNSLDSAVRAGAQYAITYPTDTTGIRAAIAGSLGISPEGLEVGVDRFCECTNGSAVACNGICADGSAPCEYVRVQTSRAFNPVLTHHIGVFPEALTNTTVVRVK